MTMCAARRLRVTKFWSLRRALMRPERILQAGTEELSNGNRRAERTARRPGERWTGRRATIGSARCFQIRDSASSPQINYQGPTGHEEAAVNVAEGLRVECGHGLVIVHSATAIQNLQLAVCNGKADLGAILVEYSGGHFPDCSVEI